MQRHPFSVDAYFRSVLVLTYAYPTEVLEPLLPPGLVLDTYQPTQGVHAGQGDRLNTIVHVVFTMLWAYFTLVCVWALVEQFGLPAS